MSARAPAADRGVVAVALVVVVAALVAVVLLVSDPHAGAAGGSAPKSACGSGAPTAADREFVSMMREHHEQAVDMVGLLREAPDVPSQVARFAERVGIVQAGEVADMETWSQKAGGGCDQATASGHGGHGGGKSGADHQGMPGMLDEDQLDALATLRGEAAAREFLVLMIEHHEGAIAMSEPVVRSTEDAWVLGLSRHVVADQVSEIGAMRRMLADL